MPEFDDMAFSAQRSHNTANAANENSRPMAQAALLINGAAASGFLAFLFKEGVEPPILKAAYISLSVWGVGVVLGSIAMYAMTESLDLYSYYWQCRARNKMDEAHSEFKRANRSWKWVRATFFSSMGCFVIGGGILAFALLQLPARSK